MALVITEKAPIFDLEKIRIGDFVRARHRTWKEEMNGIVVSVHPEQARIIYLPGIYHAIRYFTIRAQELHDGEWAIMHSRDLQSVEKVEMTNGYG